MKIEAKSVDDYIYNVSEEKREAVAKLRDVIAANIPEGFIETISYDMIGYVVPLELYPKGYRNDRKTPLPFINIAAQKNFIAFYHMGIYSNDNIKNWFIDEYDKRCSYKLDMGKSCIRFKKIDDIPYSLIGELCKKITAEEWIATYEAAKSKP